MDEMLGVEDSRRFNQTQEKPRLIPYGNGKDYIADHSRWVQCEYVVVGESEKRCSLPNGHPGIHTALVPGFPQESKHMGLYAGIGADIGRLVEKKQIAYGDSFGKSGEVVRILYPSGVPIEKLDDALAIIRVIDKLFRIATDRDALGESPWRDIAGYALLATERNERPK